MPYRICKSFTVESGHILSKHPGDCRFPHGHSRTVEIILTADSLDANDMVCDFKALKPAIKACLARYDHTLALNTDDPNYAALSALYGDHVISFEKTDPTSEAIACDLYQTIKIAMQTPHPHSDFPIPKDVKLERVRISETGTSWAEYWE